MFNLFEAACQVFGLGSRYEELRAEQEKHKKAMEAKLDKFAALKQCKNHAVFVHKVSGYPWIGIVRSGFQVKSGYRWNVENLLVPGCIHIFSTDQLEIIDTPSAVLNLMHLEFDKRIDEFTGNYIIPTTDQFSQSARQTEQYEQHQSCQPAQVSLRTSD